VLYDAGSDDKETHKEKFVLFKHLSGDTEEFLQDNRQNNPTEMQSRLLPTEDLVHKEKLYLHALPALV
jgi:hypothetical protein